LVVNSDESEEDSADRAVLKTQACPLVRAELIESMILKKAAEQNRGNTIVRLRKVFLDSFIDSTQHPVILQLDLARCTLQDFITKQKDKVVVADNRRRIVKNIVDALVFLHTELGMQHGDLKTSNVLVVFDGSAWSCQLADFGLATSPQFAAHGTASTTYSFARRAPELFDDLCQKPVLIREGPVAHAALANMSCFDEPAEINEMLLSARVEEFSKRQCEFQTPPSNKYTSVNSTPETVSLHCNETLDSESPPVVTKQPIVQNDFVAPLAQATERRHHNVTRAMLESDIWGLGSLILNVWSLGKHPIQECAVFWTEYTFSKDLQSDRRAQLYYWYRFLVSEQFSNETWPLLFDFRAIVTHFELFFKSQIDNDLHPTLRTLNDIAQSIGASADEIDFLIGCLQFVPSDRPNVHQLTSHNFLAKNCDTEKLASKTDGNGDSRKRKLANSIDYTPKLAFVPGEKRFRFVQMESLLRCVITEASGDLERYNLILETVLSWSYNYFFSYKTVFLAMAYCMRTFEKVVPWQNRLKPAWCKAHAIACLLLAVSIYENRHEAHIDNISQRELDNGDLPFVADDLTRMQRLIIKALDFNFNICTAAVLIDASLLQASQSCDETVFIEPLTKAEMMLSARKMLSHRQFACPTNAVSSALALLKYHNLTEAHDILLAASGRNSLSSEYAVRDLRKMLSSKQ